MRGRKPSLKLVEADAANMVEGHIFEPPSHVPPSARAEWLRVCADLASRGLLSEITLPLVTSYTLAIWNVATCMRAIKRDGGFVRGKSGEIRVHPAQQQMNQAQQMIVRLGSELGLSPTARARSHFNAPPEKQGGADDWSDMDI
jgi:P27 family predicted phage terminase small subunit